MGSRGASSASSKAAINPAKKETYTLPGGMTGRVSENQIVDYMRQFEGYKEAEARTAIRNNDKLKTKMAKELMKSAMHLYPEDFK